MPGHADFIARFDAGLRGDGLPPGLSIAHDPAADPAADPPDASARADEIARRFAVYQNNVATSLGRALASRFPAIARLVGETFFAALARAYLQDARPASPVLAEWGAEFADFLDAFPPLAAYPYLGDVARIEQARGRAFHAADAPAMNPAHLAMADPEALRLPLHPSVTLLALAHPAVSIWARNQPGGAAHPLATGPQIALIWRDRHYDVQVRAIPPADAAMIAALMAGATLSQAATRACALDGDHDPQPLLVTLMRAGAITQCQD